MSSKVQYPYSITKNTATVTKDGEPLAVHSTQPIFSDVKQAITAAYKSGLQADWDVVFTMMNPIEYVTSKSNDRIHVRDSGVFITGDDGEEFRVPSDLGDTLMLHIDEQLPLEPLVNFAIKLNLNPSNRSVQQLFGFISANNITITENGNFVAYKGVRSDFTDSHTGTMDNSVGKTVKVQRNQVDEDPDAVCSYGLHVAAYDYAHNYYGSGGGCGVTLVVEVNPRDVVAVPVDYNNAKMRVCEYSVVGVSKGEKISKPLFTEKDREEMWPSSDLDDEGDDDIDDEEEDDEDEGEEEEDQCGCDWCRRARGDV